MKVGDVLNFDDTVDILLASNNNNNYNWNKGRRAFLFQKINKVNIFMDNIIKEILFGYKSNLF